MPKWVEYEDTIVVDLGSEGLHPDSIFDAETEQGIVFSFGEPKSKLGSGRYRLANVAFDNEIWNFEDARAWWGSYMVFAFKEGKYGLDRRLMPVEAWYEFDDGLHLFVCRRGKKGEYAAIDYIKGRVETPDTEAQVELFSSGSEIGADVPENDLDALHELLQEIESKHSRPAIQLISDILSIEGQKIVTISIPGVGGQAIDIDRHGSIGYAASHKVVFLYAILTCFEEEGGIIIRQFLDFGATEHQGDKEIFIPRKNLYGVSIKVGKYRFLTAEEVELACNTDAVTGEPLKLEKYVFYCGFPVDESDSSDPWDDLKL